MRAAYLANFSFVKNGYPLRQYQGLHRIGSGIKKARLKIILQHPEIIDQFFPQLEIETGQGVIKQIDIGILYNAPRHGHTLLLAAAQLGREFIQQILDMQHGGRPLNHRCYLGGGHFHEFERISDIIKDGFLWVQGKALRDVSHVSDFRRHFSDILAPQNNVTVVRFFQPHQQTQEHGFPRRWKTVYNHEIVTFDR